MIKPTPASSINVREFRQILAWPFVMPENWSNGALASEDDWFAKCIELLNSSRSTWEEKSPRDLMKDGETGIYEEANRFHDYISDTLFNDNLDEIRTFQRSSLRRISFQIQKTDNAEHKFYDFEVLFNSLHIYKCGVAILTLELLYSDDELTLDEAQILAHRVRRANPPFWSSTDSPKFCAQLAVLHEEFGNSLEIRSERNIFGLGDLKNRASAQEALINAKFRQPIFSWWREILKPLYVEGDLNNAAPSMLRQIMDERIPLLTTISLIDDQENYLTDDRMPTSILHFVSNADWIRIAEATEEGFAADQRNSKDRRNKLRKYSYDRFMPSVGKPSEDAARFTFALHHFAAVGAGSFFDSEIIEQVRRRYRHMHHLCLLELAAVLRISQHLSQVVKEQKPQMNHDSNEKFRNRIRDMQEMFMKFTHRHHFTGVSNELQAREVFTAFRNSMELDRRYREINYELESAANLALSIEQMKIAKSTNQLTEIATVAAIILVAAALTGSIDMIIILCQDCSTIFSRNMIGNMAEWAGAKWLFNGWSFGIWLLVTLIGSSLLFRDHLRKSRNMRRYIFWTFMFALSIIYISLLSCCPFPYSVGAYRKS